MRSSFKPVEKLKMADGIVSQIQERVFNGTYAPGDRIPPERELAKELNVNRNTLREALKKLEFMGLVKSRQGDGTVVLDYRKHAGVDVLGPLLLSEAISNEKLFVDVLEARHLLGIDIAGLAAKRRDEKDIISLRNTLDSIKETEGDLEGVQMLEFDFFYNLALASGNMVYVLIINSTRELYRKFSFLYRVSAEKPEVVFSLLESVLSCVENGDSDRAEKAMDEYLSFGNERIVDHLKIRKVFEHKKETS